MFNNWPIMNYIILTQIMILFLSANVFSASPTTFKYNHRKKEKLLSKVNYFSSSQRAKCQIEFKRTSKNKVPFIYWSKKGKKVEDLFGLYIVDKKDRIYVYGFNSKKSGCPGLKFHLPWKKHPYSSMKHSSFLGGKEVIAAGTISIYKGRLRGISNHSSHYMPDDSAIKDLLIKWTQKGVPTDGVLIKIVEFYSNIYAISNAQDHFYLWNEGLNKPIQYSWSTLQEELDNDEEILQEYREIFHRELWR